MKIYKDRIFNFVEIFNEKNGFFLRSNVLDENGSETAIKPECRSYPELIDIGIVGSCQNKITCKEFGILCYQNDLQKPDMHFTDYKKIIDQSVNKTFQVALGGRGDPNKHKDFIEILKYTRKNGIVPNLTTSGTNISEKEIKAIIRYCGSVAVSMYSRVINGEESNCRTVDLINYFATRIPTNIHYVISNKTIDDAIYRLNNDFFPNNINGVIFLLYKPVGLAKNDIDNLITFNDPKLHKFFDLIFNKNHKFKIGFDTCFYGLICSYNPLLQNNPSIQNCESGAFSCYIDSDLSLFPCSFIKDSSYQESIINETIDYIWNNSEKLHRFRQQKKCSAHCTLCKQ